MTRIEIDLNVRVGPDLTYSGFDEVDGDPAALKVGDPVEVFEPECRAFGSGEITEIDLVKELIFIRVSWKSLHVPVEKIALDA